MSSAATDVTSITTPWPAGFPAHKPGPRGFAVREVAAPADAVYEWLLRPDLHVEHYRGLHHVKLYGGARKLAEGTTVSFFLGPLFVPPMKVVQADPQLRSLAWASNAPGFKACHCFTVKPIDDDRSLLRSEELWVGPAARATGLLTAPVIQKVQTDWVEAVVALANRHPAGPPAPAEPAPAEVPAAG
ncbi:MAG: hypothetical protein PGN13_12000 [Patulibacter minatonensis]